MRRSLLCWFGCCSMMLVGLTGCGDVTLDEILAALGDVTVNIGGPGGGGVDDGTGGAGGGGTVATQLDADLRGGVTSRGRAEWNVGAVQTEFKVEVESGTPDAVLDIVVDGVTVGQLTLDGTGFGELKFRDPPDDNPGLNEFPFPANFPSPLVEGSVVAVGDLQGTLAVVAAGGGGADDGTGTGTDDGTGTGDGTGTDDGTGTGDGTGTDDGTGSGDGSGTGDGTGGGGAALTSLTAVFTGTGGFGDADWEVRSDRTSFKVEVESGTPGAVLDIVVGGVTVWQLTLDAVGFGEVEFRDPPDNNPAINEFPFPDNFPADVGVGTVVSAGSLTGELQPAP